MSPAPYPQALQEAPHSQPRCQSCGYVGPFQVEPLLLTHHIVIFVVLLLAFGGGLVYLLVILLMRSSESNRAKICPSCGSRNMFTFVYQDGALGPPAGYGAAQQVYRPQQYAAPPSPAATVFAGSAGVHSGPSANVLLNGRQHTALALTPGSRWIIGRGPASQIRIADEMVSTSHAQLRVKSDGSLGLSDTGSTNGTFVNGAPISAEHRVRAGDVIALGTDNAKLTVEYL